MHLEVTELKVFRKRIQNAFFELIRKGLIELISRELNDLRSARVQMTVWIRFRKDNEIVELAFNSRMTDFFKGSDFGRLIDGMINHMTEQIENPALMNSRFVFDRVLFLDVNFHRLNLNRGSSYIPLPEFIARKKAVINPQNEDNECFKWAVIESLHNLEIKKDHNRIFNLRKFECNYDWSDLSFPTSLKEIRKFELANGILINVSGIEGKDIYLCRKGGKYTKEANLLLISEDDKWHYTSVKSLNRLLRSGNTKHKSKQHFCMNCLQGFTEESVRDNHYTYCVNNELVRVEMPTKVNLKFSDGQGQLKAPFVIYADFESILEPMNTCSNDPTISHTNHVNKHTTSGFCTYSKFAYRNIDEPLKL